MSGGSPSFGVEPGGSPERKGAREPFLAFVDDEAAAEPLRNYCRVQGWAIENVKKGGIIEAVTYLKHNRTPLVLCIDIGENAAAAQALDQLADVCEPDVRVFIAGTVNEFSFYRHLKEMGVEDYLLKPLQKEVVEKAFAEKHTAAAPQVTAQEAPKEQRVVAIIGARGGVGATTIAVNLGDILARRHGLSTVIFDPDPHFGSVALAFDLEPSRGLRDALEKPDRVDALYIERVTVRHSEKLGILSSEESYDRPLVLHPDASAIMLRELQKSQECVVVDLPRIISAFTTQLLAKATHILVVTELSVPSLRDTMRLLDRIKEISGGGNVSIVANRIGMMKKTEMPAAEFAKSLGRKIDYQVHFEPEAPGLANAGKVLAEEAKHCRVIKEIEGIASDILNLNGKEHAKGGVGKLLGIFMKD